jgi:hypothetical protein
MRGLGAAVAASVSAIALAVAPSAGAATPVGTTFVPDSSCTANKTYVISGPVAYEVPSDGVITSWSHQTAGMFVQSALKLKMARPAGGNSFTIVGDSERESTLPSQLNTFPTRIPVLAGDVMGLHTTDGVGFCAKTTIGYDLHELPNVDLPPGSTATFGTNTDYQFDIGATLEPDADRDGYGDETQDCAPADATKNTDCAPPDAAITSGPKDKTRKKQATFVFAGTDARAVAGFECSLDGGAFTACTSPLTLKVRRGRHTFAVRANDQAGNVDGSPATDAWKVKRRKKKK